MPGVKYPAIDNIANIDEVKEGMDSTPAQAGHGMVCTSHPIATGAGLNILKSNGNAFDAAVAIAAILNVVEPMMSGIGGYGTILIYDAENKQVRFLDSSGKIPSAVDSDVFRPPTPHYLENRRGAKAVSTPGNVNAWESMHTEYGRMAWRDLFKTAISTAREGFTINKRTAELIRQSFDFFPPHAKLFYGYDGTPLKAGDVLHQQDLAHSLELIAENGAKAFYGGEIGKAIDAEMRRTGGFLSMSDLIADRAEWWEPISIDYKGYQVYTASPPSTAFPSLIRLGIMSRFDVRHMGHNCATSLHRFAEVTKHAFWCRLAYAGDPEINPPPLDKLLSESYWEEQAAQIDLDRAKPFMPPNIRVKQGKNTTHYVVADRWGNIVSATQTLGDIHFASKIMPPGTGIWLNDSLSFCTFEPKGNPMDAHPGQRKLSGDCPTIIMRNRRPWAALGTPGGHTIGQTVPQMIMNMVDFEMNIREAIAAPRISFSEPDTLKVEAGIAESVRADLIARGHHIELTRSIGNAHGLTIKYDSSDRPVSFTGGSDPRGGGKAAGY